MAPILLVFLLALLGGILALYEVARDRGLYRAAFVYEYDVGSITVFAPYSIIPTLLAIITKLWFESIEDVLKRVQAFTSMAYTPTGLSRSLLAEYSNTPSVLTSVKALEHSHWMLTLIGIIALVTEICKTSSCSGYNPQAYLYDSYYWHVSTMG